MPKTNKSAAIIKRSTILAIWTSVFILYTANFLSAQESTHMDVPDSLISKHPINQSLLHSFDTLITLSPSLRKLPIYSTWYLRQSLTNLPSSLSSPFQQQIDVISPWKQEMARENELRTLKWVLQSVQAGATAYILYEHIRKYGLK